MKRTLLRKPALIVMLALSCASLSWSGDTSVLRPPKGSKVAILVFEDLQCPDCARAAPLLHEAAKKYNIPLVQYDFPLPMHNWSFEAAVNARYFDSLPTATDTAKTASKSKTSAATNAGTTTKTVNKLGDEYRLFIFANQPQITPQNLHGMTERFAADNKVAFPFVVDPSGELTAKVKADYAMGQRVGLQHTPTIYVVSDTARGTPFVEVVDRTQLYQLIDKVMKDAGTSSPAPKTTAAKSTSTAKASKAQ
jgi:protein-disulfide isomerase